MQTDGALIGREEEIRSIHNFLDAITSGPEALVIEGEQGIGKTALWTYAVSKAVGRSYRVLVCRPAEFEVGLAFSGLGDLLEHVVEEVLPELPHPQGRALESALLRTEPDSPGTAQEHRAISLAVLSSLRALAVSSPVIIAVDDLQSLDDPSAKVLAFVARRLEDWPIGLVLAKRRGELARGPGRLIEGLPESRTERLRLAPLGARALDRILRDRLGTTLPPRTMTRLHTISAGNPLYAMEIARASLEDDKAAPDMLPIPESLRGLVARRVASLPAKVRDVLLVAAALSHPTVELVRAVMSDRRQTDAALDRAAQRGIITTVDEATLFLGLDPDRERRGRQRIRFTHPLQASVIYADARLESRRRVHRRLAQVLTDPEERAQHMALGSETTSERAAARVEEAAEGAMARGAPETAAELGEHACRLTPANRIQEARRRVISTARYSFEAGDAARARELLEGAVALSSPGPEKADALRRLGWLRYHQDSYSAAAELLKAAGEEAGGNLALRLAIERDLAWAALRFGRTTTAARHARAALKLAEGLNDPVALAESLTAVGLAEAVLGKGVRQDILQRALELEEEAKRRDLSLPPSRKAFALLRFADDLDAARTRYLQMLDSANSKGNQGSLPDILAKLSEIEFRSGRWSEAEADAEEGYEAAIRTGQELSRARLLYARALVHAHRGAVDTARVEAQEGMLLSERTEAAGLAVANQSVMGFIELSLENPAAAHGHMGPLVDLVRGLRLTEPEAVRFLPDEIEALLAFSEVEQASQLLDLLKTRGRSLGVVWAKSALARCEGLALAADGSMTNAVQALERAERLHRDLGQPFELARTLLALGMVRRRDKQKKRAREALQAAADIFDELGAVLWSRRARSELARVSGRRAEPKGLTPTEWRVANLVAQGRSNSAIADAMFLKLKTVESNLSRIYHKVGVGSRTGLAAWVHAQKDRSA